MNRNLTRWAFCIVIVCPSVSLAHSSARHRLHHLEESAHQHSDKAESLLKQALIRLEISEYDVADKLLLRAQKLDPSLTLTYLLRARCAFNSGHFEEAKVQARIYLSIEPETSAARMLLARTHRELGDMETAIADGLLLLSLPGKISPGHAVEVGQWLREAGRDAEAIAVLETAFADSPQSVLIVSTLIDTLVEMGQGVRALQYVTELPTQVQDSPKGVLLRGRVLEAVGAPDLAIAQYNLALEAMKRLPNRRRTSTAIQRDGAEAAAGIARLAGP